VSIFSLKTTPTKKGNLGSTYKDTFIAQQQQKGAMLAVIMVMSAHFSCCFTIKRKTKHEPNRVDFVGLSIYCSKL
jgi:hypothetical protein